MSRQSETLAELDSAVDELRSRVHCGTDNTPRSGSCEGRREKGNGGVKVLRLKWSVVSEETAF